MTDTAPAFNAKPFFWVIAALSAILLLAPIRHGELPGYDDAAFSHVAKDMVRTGDWFNPHSNGYPVLEHPPLYAWTMATLFSLFGVSDFMAKLPAALAGWGTILVTFALARRLLRNEFTAITAMFVLAATAYFVKYTAHAMTDVPFVFLFTCAIYAWVRAREERRWLLAVALFIGLSMMTRGLMGFALPAIFIVDTIVGRGRPPLRLAVPALLLALMPLAIWYLHLFARNGDWLFRVQEVWLSNQVYGELEPSWRRYTGAFEYAFMLAKSYWPWLPAMIAGAVVVIRARDNERRILLIWTAIVFVLCAAARARVLRYLLPAYPAFSILAAIGLVSYAKRAVLERGLRLLLPIASVVVVAVAVFLPEKHQAEETKSLAEAAARESTPGERVAFYDEGQPRFDESNQLLWYGERYLYILYRPGELAHELLQPRTTLFLVDRKSYDELLRPHPHRIIAERGHLILIRLSGMKAAG